MRYSILFVSSLFLVEEILCQHKCLAIVKPRFDECSLKENTELPPGNCTNVDVCRRVFNFTHIDMVPFLNLLNKSIENLFYACCGRCEHRVKDNHRFIKYTELTRSIVDSSNFLYPVLAAHDATRIYNHHFIPLLDLAGGYYLTRRHTAAEVMKALIISCGDLWSLFVIILLLSIIAGYIVWLLETWHNKEEFPRKFFVGLFDGFWWSFVSMTTVGYGDKTPKFFISRLFAVIWIIVGITICSLFTASLTTEIQKANTAETPDMAGKVVGVLKYHAYDASVIGEHGATIKESSGKGTLDDTIELKRMLKNGEVNGTFVDRYTLMHITRYVGDLMKQGIEDTELKAVIKFFMEETVKTKVAYAGQKMAYGVMVKGDEDYEYFNEFIKENRGIFETCLTLSLNVKNNVIRDPVHDIFSPDGTHFHITLIVTGCIVGAILIFGAVFECCRRKRILPVV